jgi:hypothetical protein
VAQLPTIEQVSAPVPPERELVLAQPDANTMDILLAWVGKLIGTAQARLTRVPATARS